MENRVASFMPPFLPMITIPFPDPLVSHDVSFRCPTFTLAAQSLRRIQLLSLIVASETGKYEGKNDDVSKRHSNRLPSIE